MNETPTNLDDYNYFLPEKLIAQAPSKTRESSKLLVFNKKTALIEHTNFEAILEKLPKNALIIANNSKVVPARILGHRQNFYANNNKKTMHSEKLTCINKIEQGGAKLEMLIMTPVPLLEKNAFSEKEFNHIMKDYSTFLKSFKNNLICTQNLQKENTTLRDKKFAFAEVLLKGAKRVKKEEELIFHSLNVTVLEKQDFGKYIVAISWKDSLSEELEKYGSLPLPPYIKRPEGNFQNDKTRYQTIYAKNTQAGSVAAPTAGLHFTKKIQENLLKQGFLWEEVTLHVGYGTFSPVRTQNILEHRMHAEYVEISEKTAKAVLKAKKEGRPIIAVGTTATRSLEGMAEKFAQETQNSITHTENIVQNSFKNNILPETGCSGFTDIFIYPSKAFQVIDGLITNFHLPKSSLLMLVSAFAGYENIKKIYAKAIEEEYRFFSYGDAMLILN